MINDLFRLRMAADHFCLRWNNYQSNMVSELDILRTEEHLVDVTLSCEGQKFRAHKVILSACSAYFRNVFKVSHGEITSLGCNWVKFILKE